MKEENKNVVSMIKEIVEKYRDGLPSDGPMNDKISQAVKYLDDILHETGKLTVETPMGTMIAYPSSDSHYPGILIDLHRPDCKTDAPLCMSEYTETEGDAEGAHIITRVWEDVRSMEYTDRFIHEKIDEFFRGDVEDE